MDTSRGGSQEVPSDGQAVCDSSSSQYLVLSETMNNTVTYTYRVMWNVRIETGDVYHLPPTDMINTGIGHSVGNKMGQLPAHLRSCETTALIRRHMRVTDVPNLPQRVAHTLVQLDQLYYCGGILVSHGVHDTLADGF